MKNYLGTKHIKAKPMTRGEFMALKQQNELMTGTVSDQGYLVEYQDGGKPNVDGYDGYVSWSPKDVFDKAYRETEGLSFGLAVEAMKAGLKATRVGWNDAGMFAYYVPAASYPASRNTKGTMLGVFPDDMVPYREYMALKTAQGDVATWTPSVSDALADDWQIVE